MKERGKGTTTTLGPILGFQGQFRFLSNFYEMEIYYLENRVYKSAEHAYQSEKTYFYNIRQDIINAESPGKAKRLGSTCMLRPEWEYIKLERMFTIVRRKFDNALLRRLLLETGNRELVELNNWGDKFWGMVVEGGKLAGENHLGKILMIVREEARRGELFDK